MHRLHHTSRDPGAITDRPALRDPRDDLIDALIDHNQAKRLHRAMRRPELAHLPVQALQKLCAAP